VDRLLKGELGEFQIYFKKLGTLASTKTFGGFSSFVFALLAEKFETMFKMTLY